jgi:hypothetical protein
MAILQRRGQERPPEGPTPILDENGEGEQEGGLDKSFGHAKNFREKFELGKGGGSRAFWSHSFGKGQERRA